MEVVTSNELVRAITALRQVAPGAAKEALFNCAQHCKALAVRYAPRSPTMKNRSATLKRKRRTTSRRFPGNLEKSISCESDASRAAVYVARNAYCVSSGGFNYAAKMHDERGKTWRNLGAGSIAKGGKVGDKFILRAIQDSAEWCLAAFTGRLSAALGRTWRG